MTTPIVSKLRELLDGEAPSIAVSFSDETTDAELELAAARGLDVAEIRIDRFSSFDPEYVLDQVRRFRRFPTIATIRTDREGGEWTGADDDRLRLFVDVLPHVDAIDIELSSTAILAEVIAQAALASTLVIVSNHDFEATPTAEELRRTATDAKDAGADYVKIAAWARSRTDVQTLASFTLEHAELGLIVIAMGPHGTTSRIFFPQLGSRLTYAYWTSRPVPGQLDFDATFEALRVFYPEFDQKKTVELERQDNA